MAGIIAVTLFAGCLNTKVGIRYTPQTNALPVVGGARVPVSVDVKDVRLIKNSVGFVDIYIQDAGDLTYTFSTTNDVVIAVKQAIEDELANRGFKPSESGVSILAGLNKFYYDDPLGTTLALSVQVKKPDGDIIYSKLVTGNGRHRHFFGNQYRIDVQKSLNEAPQNCVTQLFADPSFVDGLLIANTASSTTGT